MQRREHYKGCDIVARSHKLKQGGFSAEFCIQEDDGDGFLETEYSLPGTFPTRESAIKAAMEAGRREIDARIELGSAVVNR